MARLIAHPMVGANPRPVWRYALAPLLVVHLLTVVGCGGDTTGPTPPTPAQTYWTLALNQHAINMATVASYNTVRLTATPRNVLGVPLTSVGAVTFRASDSAVTVDSTGLVTAHFTTQAQQPTLVTASLTAQGVTLTDTVFIQVTDTVPHHPLVRFSLQPVAGDSAKRSMDAIGSGYLAWPVTAIDAIGNSVCNVVACALQVAYTSSNPQVANFQASMGKLNALDTGHVNLIATSLYYGVALRDSVLFTVGNSLNEQAWMTMLSTSGAPRVGFRLPKVRVLGVGAVLWFFNKIPGYPVDVVFDHPETIDTASVVTCFYCDGAIAPPHGRGNIAPFGGDTINNANDIVARRFPVAGTYRMHSATVPSDTVELVIK